MSILGLEKIVYGVDDVDLCRRFFLDWGLAPDGDAASATVFRTLDRCSVVVRPKDDPALPPAIEPGSTVREIAWGVEAEADLDDIAGRLRGLTTVTRAADGAVRCTDPAGMAVAFTLSRRVPLPPVGAAANTTSRPVRIDKPGTIYERAAPRCLGHIVLAVPDVDAGERFYSQALGFPVSDRYRGRGVFLRCKEEQEHHQMFLLKSADGRTHFNHLAFEVFDVHEVFGGGLAFSRRGWETNIGPGRHVLSSCYFWYFQNPSGGACEYYADCDWMTGAWTPREFEQVPSNFAEWALGKGIEQYGGTLR
jgi:catechol 2,3-dioxygenase-like lactoylglutathione lyase family enzyme